MEGLSQTSSRQSNPLVTKVKALLMRAWRERWNEVQWGIQLKRVMSTSPGDNKDLAGNHRAVEIPCPTCPTGTIYSGQVENFYLLVHGQVKMN